MTFAVMCHFGKPLVIPAKDRQHAEYNGSVFAFEINCPIVTMTHFGYMTETEDGLMLVLHAWRLGFLPPQPADRYIEGNEELTDEQIVCLAADANAKQ